MNSTSPKPHRTAIAIAIILALGAAAAAAIVYGTQPAAVSAEGHGHGAAEKSHSHEENNGHEHDEKEGHDHGSEPGHEQAASAGKPAAKPESAHADDEDEGLLKLDAERARAAGVALAEAGPALIASMLQLPGEIRFNEDRTAHVVPRVAGVAESVAANLGQVVKKGQLLATLTSPAVSEQRSELMAAQKRLALARTTYQR